MGHSFLEYGGLNPILPFLGGRSDAARRAASWSSPTPFPSGFYNDAACRVVISHRAAKLRARWPPVWGIARQELQ